MSRFTSLAKVSWGSSEEKTFAYLCVLLGGQRLRVPALQLKILLMLQSSQVLLVLRHQLVDLRLVRLVLGRDDSLQLSHARGKLFLLALHLRLYRFDLEHS